MKKFLYPILAVIVFLIMQAAAGIVITIIGAVSNPELMKQVAASGDTNALMQSVNPAALGWAVVVSGFLTVGVLALLKMIDWKHVLNFGQIRWGWGAVSIVAAIMGIFVLDIVEEMIDLPNLMEDTFTDMSNSLIGALCIGVLGPIAEEFIFREAFLGYMLREGVNKWVAIAASALAFGIIHLNPAQVPFAAAMGVLFGLIYYKTGNIVITSILHIMNNSVAVWMMYSMGEAGKDFSLIEWLGGPVSTLAISIPLAVVSIVLIYFFWKKYKTTYHIDSLINKN